MPVLSTEFREPHNFAQDTDGGGIHDDAVAKKVGMRGGTVAGSIHINQFVPLCTQAFGAEEWFSNGCLSAYFLSPTVHLEPVKAFARLPEDGVCSMEIWMETEAGTKVLEGTASVGCGLTDPLDHPSALAARLARERPPGREGLRIMANLEVGQQSDRIPARYNYGAKLEGMGNLEWGPAQALLTTEPLDWYVSDDTSPWGHKVLPPQHMFNIFNARQYPGDHWPTREKIRGGGAAVGLLGGVEVRTCGKGPILCDHDYTVEWEIVGLGASPKAENSWTKGILRELDGTIVAESLTMNRSLKASSPLYAEDNERAKL